MICTQCGNAITVPGCEPDPEYWTPVCLVCQHTGRTVECMENYIVAEAKARLAQRIADPSHNRKKPDWDEEDRKEQDREPVCQSCLGTGRYGNRRCPDCYEPDERD